MQSAQPALPGFWDVVFSLKTFAAACLALYVAFLCDLPNPYWALAAVYIVAHPLSGALTSKALYRLLGTAIGGMATVVMLPQLINSPELTTLGLALWLGACLFCSLLDRSPRSYVFMLAGYTATLIAFPIVDTPTHVFDYATSRAEEIGIGIICAALISRLVFPRHAGPVLASRIDNWLKDSADLAIKSLMGEGNDDQALTTRRKLATDAVDLRNFTTHIAYDTSSLRSTVHAMRILQSRMVALLPMVASANDLVSIRKRLLTDKDQQKPAQRKLDQLIGATIEFLEREKPFNETERDQIIVLRDDILETFSGAHKWIDLISRNLTVRLSDLIQIYSDCLNLKLDIINGTVHQMRWKRSALAQDTQQAIHYDYGMAALSAFAAMLATVISVMFWRLTEWPQGGTAAMMTGISCCLFATMDDPVPMIRTFNKMLIIVVLIAFIFQFALLPLVDSYFDLVLCLAFALIPAGIWMTIPSKFMLGLSIGVNLPNLLLLQARFNDDFYVFINANAAMILGIIIAASTTAVVRSVGAEWSAMRLVKSGYNDIIAISDRQRDVASENRLLHRMLDRFGQFVPRLSAIAPESAAAKADIIRDVRVGINAIDLQQKKNNLGPTSRQSIDRTLDELGRYYSYKLKHHHDPEENALINALDDSLRRILKSSQSHQHQDISFALTGLRQNLFPFASPFLMHKTTSETTVKDRP